LTITAHFNKGYERGLHLIRNYLKVDDNIKLEISAVCDWIQLYANRASNWLLLSVNKFELIAHKPEDLDGGCGRKVALPKSVTRCVINLEGEPSSECFKYAIVAAVHHSDIDTKNKEHLKSKSYERYLSEFYFSSLKYPVTSLTIQGF